MRLGWTSKDKEREEKEREDKKEEKQEEEKKKEKERKGSSKLEGKKQKKTKEDSKVVATEDIVTDVDFVVGIDFGQTYTGVVWTNLGYKNPTQSIEDWPGLPPDSTETKVPTRIGYPEDSSEPRGGFLCSPDDEYHSQAAAHEHFKIYLDQESLESARRGGVRNMPQSVEEASNLITDYLRQVHQHVKFSLEAATGPWKDKRVEFVFSLPTTWTSLETTNLFHSAIKKAGFTNESPLKHTVSLELTEAEAAAVYFASTPQITLSKGDILLICDAGGGTTDLGLIEVFDPDPEKPALKQVAAVKGVGIGSTMIDRAFERMVQKRIDEQPNGESFPYDLAHKLARSTSFLSIKHNFGTRAATQQIYKLPLDRLGLGISPDFKHAGLCIEEGKMQFTKADIQSLFDTQIKGMLKQIKRQLDWMQSNRASESVRYLILSGGLGGSQYVKTRIQEYYSTNPHPNAPRLLILKSQEPRLSEVKGLVMDRRQKLLNGTATLTTRIARASYGVLCRKPYDPDIHVGADVYIDPYDKKTKWALMQINWLIKKGDTIDTDSARETSFSRKLTPGETNRKWETVILISHEEREHLPTQFKGPTVSKLCQLQSDFKEIPEEELEVRNKRPWQGKRYFVAKFAVKVIIAPADLKFELWFNGVRYNRSHDPITVQWDPVGVSKRPDTPEDEEHEEMIDMWESTLGWSGTPGRS